MRNAISSSSSSSGRAGPAGGGEFEPRSREGAKVGRSKSAATKTGAVVRARRRPTALKQTNHLLPFVRASRLRAFAVQICFPLATAAMLAGCDHQPPPSAAPAPTTGPVESARNALRARQFDAAIADADDYLRGQPHGTRAAEADYIKGSAYQQREVPNLTEQRRDLFEARTAYVSALTEHPPSLLEGYVRAGLSTVALLQDDFPTCIEQATRADPLIDRPEDKARLLFDTGLAEQRLGRFTDADATFRQVAQRYPGTVPALAAQQHQGMRLFYVQLAEFRTAADADRAVSALRSAGSAVSQRTDAAGATVLDVGPFSTFAAAEQQRDALLDTYPGAVIFP